MYTLSVDEINFDGAGLKAAEERAREACVG